MSHGKYSGKFVLRVKPDLHAQISAMAENFGLSLNAICASILESEIKNQSNKINIPGFQDLNLKLKKIFPNMLGLVLFGSFSRSEATSTSDVDLLIVLPPDSLINRTLYHIIDDFLFELKNPKISLNLACLPKNCHSLTSSLWLELAIDGIVLSDTAEYAISKTLVSIREDIIRSKYKQKVASGHRYWLLN